MRVIMRRLIYEDGGRLFAAAEACIRENDPDGATINYEIAMELRQHLLITEYWCHKSPEAVGYYRSSEEVNWASSAQEIPGRKEAVERLRNQVPEIQENPADDAERVKFYLQTSAEWMLGDALKSDNGLIAAQWYRQAAALVAMCRGSVVSNCLTAKR